MSKPITVRKKPIEVQAMQWDGTADTATPIIDWVLENGGTADFRCDAYPCSGESEGHHLKIQTLEGAMKARPGWWVIRGVKNEFYPCAPDVFRETYDIIDQEEQP